MYTILIPVIEAIKLTDLRPEWEELPYSNQPCSQTYNGCRIYFKEKIQAWFLELKISYSLQSITRPDITLTFKEKQDAILFKLTWMNL